MNLEPYFEKYRSLVHQVEAVFKQVHEEYGECVACKVGCSDCCHALFDLTLIEAMFIKNQFDKVIPEEERQKLLEKADVADRKVYKLKREASKAHQQGTSENEILEKMAEERIRCPLLDDEEKCEMYASRPITCRLYGIPTAIGGQSRTCGLSNFEEGKQYPTVKLENIQRRLYEISFELAQEIKSRYPKLAEVLVPLSMALLTDYNDEYLGVGQSNQTGEEGKETRS